MILILIVVINKGTVQADNDPHYQYHNGIVYGGAICYLIGTLLAARANARVVPIQRPWWCAICYPYGIQCRDAV